ncbi:MAG: hypothetical protein J6Q85_00360 [Clostridia bacterium]|nr:hypothetical protein [Clostridia bacterium]
MASVEKNQVIDRLRRYLNENEWLEKARNKNPDFAQAIEGIQADSIYFGDGPILSRGYVWGNSTGSGESTYGDTTTKRTTSIDFNTDEYLIVADENAASMATCRAATRYVLDGYNTSDVITKYEARSIAEKEGKRLCRQALSDLNFGMSECRLNRYGIEYTSEPIKVPIWPIFTDIVDSNGKSTSVHLGYYYRCDNKDYIQMDISVPMTAKNKLIMFGAIAAAAIVVIVIIASLL